jgi:hypothetical protein
MGMPQAAILSGFTLVADTPVTVTTDLFNDYNEALVKPRVFSIFTQKTA